MDRQAAHLACSRFSANRAVVRCSRFPFNTYRSKTCAMKSYGRTGSAGCGCCCVVCSVLVSPNVEKCSGSKMEALTISTELSNALRAEYGKNATDAQWTIFVEFCKMRRLMPGRDVHLQIHSANEWDADSQAN